MWRVHVVSDRAQMFVVKVTMSGFHAGEPGVMKNLVMTELRCSMKSWLLHEMALPIKGLVKIRRDFVFRKHSLIINIKTIACPLIAWNTWLWMKPSRLCFLRSLKWMVILQRVLNELDSVHVVWQRHVERRRIATADWLEIHVMWHFVSANLRKACTNGRRHNYYAHRSLNITLSAVDSFMKLIVYNCMTMYLR